MHNCSKLFSAGLFVWRELHTDTQVVDQVQYFYFTTGQYESTQVGRVIASIHPRVVGGRPDARVSMNASDTWL